MSKGQGGGGVITAKAMVEQGPSKSTGAIPKQKCKQTAAVNKPSCTNHLDEIVSLPLDDNTAVSNSAAGYGTKNSKSSHQPLKP